MPATVYGASGSTNRDQSAGQTLPDYGLLLADGAAM
jgi:hypothetical protein